MACCVRQTLNIFFFWFWLEIGVGEIYVIAFTIIKLMVIYCALRVRELIRVRCRFDLYATVWLGESISISSEPKSVRFDIRFSIFGLEPLFWPSV